MKNPLAFGFTLIVNGAVNAADIDEPGTIAITAEQLQQNLEDIIRRALSHDQFSGDTEGHLENLNLTIEVNDLGNTGSGAHKAHGVEMQAMPVISISHLDAQTAKDLSEEGDAFSWCVCAPDAHSIFFHPFDREQLIAAEVPDCILAVADWMAANGFTWVRLDPHADAVASLPTYDW